MMIPFFGKQDESERARLQRNEIEIMVHEEFETFSSASTIELASLDQVCPLFLNEMPQICFAACKFITVIVHIKPSRSLY